MTNLNNDINLHGNNINIDNAGIYAHSNLAKYYKYRPPYMDEFYNELSSRLIINPNDKILDLCCGRGELANGMTKFVNKIHAVDGSSEMLANSIENINISYHSCNVNFGKLPFDDKFNYFLIGTAVHWIKDAALISIIKDNLATAGKICIIHRTLKFDEQDFNRSLLQLNSKFGKKPNKIDFSANQRMKNIGFENIETIRVEKMVSFNLKYLYLNQLSRAYGLFQKNIIANPDFYKTQFIERLSPFSKNGSITGKLINYAAIYSNVKNG